MNIPSEAELRSFFKDLLDGKRGTLRCTVTGSPQKAQAVVSLLVNDLVNKYKELSKGGDLAVFDDGTRIYFEPLPRVQAEEGRE